MKKITLSLLSIMLFPSLLLAEVSTEFVGGDNLNIDTSTTFAADLNDGSTGLATTLGLGLRFELMPYADRNINPVPDTLSVSLKLANSALYSWRGYAVRPGDSSNSFIPENVTGDQATSIWFDTIYAQLQYNDFWFRIAGLEPEMSVSQASMFSVFDAVMANTTASDKNSIPLPLFHSGSAYAGKGIVSVIGRDLVGITNRPKFRQVPVGGMLATGYKSEELTADGEAGSWWNTETENVSNAWVFGLNVRWKPDLVSTLSASALGAVNYQNVAYSSTELEKIDPSVIAKNPLAAGLGYEIGFELPGRMILKPVVGVDVFYEQATSLLKWEAGGGFKWYFHGSGSRYARKTSYGNTSAGSVDADVGLFVSANVNQDNQVNGLVSFNENPDGSFIPNLGGFGQLEFYNITATGGSSFLWAGIVQLEYKIGIVTPYVSGKYIPGDLVAWIYNNDIQNITSKAGVRIAAMEHFTIDIWYERTDVFNAITDWKLDSGLISTRLAISM